MKRGDIEVGAEPVDILFSVQFENSPRMGKRVKCFRVQAAILEDRIDFPTNKTMRENTCIPHTICGEKNSALFGHTNGLRQGFQLILRCKKMIHRAEQQRNLLCIALKRGQVQSIALCNGDGFPRNGIFLKEFDIVFQQFDRIDPIASLCQGVTIPACCCADFQDAHIGPKVGFYILHRGKVFHHAVFRNKALILVISIIIFRNLFFCFQNEILPQM